MAADDGELALPEGERRRAAGQPAAGTKLRSTLHGSRRLSPLGNSGLVRVPTEFLNELKARVDLVAIVSRHVALARRGREHIGLCPFHREKTPSFTINEQKGFFHCFGCGAHGDAIDFVMQHEGIGFRDAVVVLAAGEGLPLPGEHGTSAPRVRKRPAGRVPPPRPVAPAPVVHWTLDGAPGETRRACDIWRNRIPLSHPDAAPAVAYLTSRGLPPPYPETLGFAVLAHPKTGQDLPTLVVARHCPVVGKVRGIQRIFLDPAGGKYGGGKAKMSLGSIDRGRAELLPAIRPERLLVAEGVETALSAARLFGYGAAWAMCGGFPCEIALPPSVRHVLLVADNDASGISERRALALARWIIGTGRECTIEIPNSLGSDANDVLKATAMDTGGRLRGVAGGRQAASELGSR